MTKQNAWLFFIIFPIGFLFLAFIFDNAIIFVENKRLEIVTKNIIEKTLTSNVNNYYEKVKSEFDNKKITTSQLEVNYENKKLYIYNSHSITSFFGRIFNINSYRAEISMQGYLLDDKVIIEKVDYE
ncbi:MAG: hypothetical protein PHH51_01085 [Bacilli bacterium]|nr:hypothetical protein [Bacilli bacterium]MDD3895959.1 hypothetical protein [Bacilli bacterium]MDD4407861.1 hypothetical protein [Bacilli bacterium]